MDNNEQLSNENQETKEKKKVEKDLRKAYKEIEIINNEKVEIINELALQKKVIYHLTESLDVVNIINKDLEIAMANKNILKTDNREKKLDDKKIKENIKKSDEKQKECNEDIMKISNKKKSSEEYILVDEEYYDEENGSDSYDEEGGSEDEWTTTDEEDESYIMQIVPNQDPEVKKEKNDENKVIQREGKRKDEEVLAEELEKNLTKMINRKDDKYEGSNGDSQSKRDNKEFDERKNTNKNNRNFYQVSPDKRTEKKICYKNKERRYCNYDRECNFHHKYNNIICREYQRNRCKYGKYCRYVHEKEIRHLNRSREETKDRLSFSFRHAKQQDFLLGRGKEKEKD